jgi:hypothetical protein
VTIDSRVIRRVVASSLMCLAPFSHYSWMRRWPGAGSGQPQYRYSSWPGGDLGVCCEDITV